MGLDSFRVCLGLGALKQPPDRHWQFPLMFGISDSIAPLLGLAVGNSLVKVLSPAGEYLGPLVLATYGAYMIYLSLRREESERDTDIRPRLILGLPIFFSLDNFVAGLGLGFLSVSVVFAAMLFGFMSGIMSLIGLKLGAIGGRLPINGQRLGGVVVVLVALSFLTNLF